MNTESWLSHTDRPVLGAVAAMPQWMKTQYDRQTKLQPEQTDIKSKLIRGNSAVKLVATCPVESLSLNVLIYFRRGENISSQHVFYCNSSQRVTVPDASVEMWIKCVYSDCYLTYRPLSVTLLNRTRTLLNFTKPLAICAFVKKGAKRDKTTERVRNTEREGGRVTITNPPNVSAMLPFLSTV